MSNDEPLQPFTINSALAPIALPRANAAAEAHVFSTNLNLTSRPATDWRFGARFRNYTYANHMPATSITQYVAYDSNVSTTPTGGPDLYAHDRTTFDADATWDKLKPVALTVGYTHNGNGYDARILQSSGEDVFRVSADAVGSSWATFRVQYEVGSRTGSGLDEQVLIDIGEHPEMRHYDLADRTRNRFTGQVDIVPSDVWMFSVSGGLLHDDYSDTVFGLQESTGRTFSLAADYHQPNGLGAGATYNFERYTGLQQSHEGDSSDAQFDDPLRNWTSDSTETVHYFSIYATPPRIGRNTEVRFSYDFSHAEANYLYTIPAGSPITTPNQLPNVFNKLQQLHVDAAPSPLEPPRGDVLVSLRAVAHLRLRLRSQRGQRHRPAQLAGAGVRLPPVHGALVHVRREVFLVGARHSLTASLEDLHAQDDSDHGLALFAFAGIRPPASRHAQDAAR